MRESNIKNTLKTCQNIMNVQKFKKLMILKIIFERSMKTLKLNKFSFKDIANTTIFKCNYFEIVIYKIDIKKIF